MAEQFFYVTDSALENIIASAVNVAVSKRLYSLAEASEFLGISEQTLRKTKHEVGFVKIGKKIIFRGSDLQEYLSENYVSPRKL